MNDETSYSTSKKARYIISIIYLLLMAFVVGGSYFHQQNKEVTNINAIENEEIIWTDSNYLK